MINNQNAEPAKRLGDYIEKLDRSLFPKAPLPAVILPPRSCRKKFIARLNNESRDRNQWRYEINPRGSTELLGGKYRVRFVFWGISGLDWDIDEVSLDHLLIGYAAHEVRHRLQCNHRIINITRRFIGRINRTQSLEMEALNVVKKNLVKRCLPNMLYRPHEYPTEFDAYFVDHVVVSMLHYGLANGLAQISKLLKIKPRDLTKKRIYKICGNKKK